MTHTTSNATRANWAGSALLVLVIAAVGSAQAGQDPQGRKGDFKGSGVQKGREQAIAAPAAPAAGLTGGAIVGIVVARAADQTACQSGDAAACRAIEGGLVTGGAWAFVDGGISAVDDWSTRRSIGQVKMQGRAPAVETAPGIALVHRALAACDSGDADACRAFAASVRPATTAERTGVRTYTAGR